ncbi:MAG: TetR/AcrR family transcriptional regulator [Proteobacteria bacterium]|nr:TetR/AcrR family transcriptional regulator [Pseudomonadota bacterium]
MGKGARTRATILAAAAETACLAGFDGLNLQPLADKVGMTKSGLYAHFGSKEALQIATLEYAAELFQARVVAPAKTEGAGLPRLAGVFGRWLEWPANAALPGNCPFFAGVVEFDDAAGPVRERLVRLFRDFRAVVEQLVASAVRHGHLGAGTDPAQFAHELLALRYAHHWAQGFMHDPAADARTRAAFARLVGGRA